MLLSLGVSFSETASCVSQVGLRDDLEVLTLLPPSPECEDYSLLPPCCAYVVLGAEPMCAGKAPLLDTHPKSNDLLILSPLRLKEKAHDLGS